MNIPWWEWLPFWAWRAVGAVDSADDVPDKLPRNGAVIVASGQRQKWIAFDCPCRGGHRVLLNLDPARKPAWTLSNAGGLTISPSVDYHDGRRRCHYIVRAGKISWAKDTVR